MTCFMDLQPQAHTVKLPCGHVLHRECGMQHLLYSRLCPACNQEIRADKLLEKWLVIVNLGFIHLNNEFIIHREGFYIIFGAIIAHQAYLGFSIPLYLLNFPSLCQPLVQQQLQTLLRHLWPRYSQSKITLSLLSIQI
jgi:hypothetical protein